MADQTLPRISEQTRQKLKARGFTNHLYDYLNMPQCFIPRAPGFNAYTYTVMGLSVVGGVIAKQYGFARRVFLIPFIGAPFMAFYQKKQADFNTTSDLSRRHPSITLQHFPSLNKAFKQVNAEVDQQIKKYEERVRILENKVHRGE